MIERCAVCGSHSHRPESDTNYQKLPHQMQRGFRAYIEGHQPMGSVGMSLLRNDLCGAVSRADGINQLQLGLLVQWLINEAPSNCWGSPEAVDAWINAGGP